jgi:hypothetical protein
LIIKLFISIPYLTSETSTSTSIPMFVHNFNHTLQWLPTKEDGHLSFMEQIHDKEAVLTPAAEFLTLMQSYAEPQQKKVGAKILMTAYAFTKFPTELLSNPEQQTMLLTKANHLVDAISGVIADNKDDVVPKATVLQFLLALDEYSVVFEEWRRSDQEILRARLIAAVGFSNI